MNKNERDFQAYLKFGSDNSDFYPWGLSNLVAVGPTKVLQAFSNLDSKGICPVECDNPQMLQTVLHGKASINFHIKELWSYGISDALDFSVLLGWASLLELKKDLNYLPDWVFKAIWSLAVKNKNLQQFDYSYCLETFKDLENE